MKIEDVIKELIEIILIQEKEIESLQLKLDYIDQYIEFYEKQIKEKNKWRH